MKCFSCFCALIKLKPLSVAIIKLYFGFQINPVENNVPEWLLNATICLLASLQLTLPVCCLVVGRRFGEVLSELFLTTAPTVAGDEIRVENSDVSGTNKSNVGNKSKDKEPTQAKTLC